jgi:aspartate aminotransferase
VEARAAVAREPFPASARLAGLETPASLAMARRAAELRARGVEIVDLSVGEPRLRTPVAVIEAAHRAFRSGLTRYAPSWGQPALTAAFAERLRLTYGLDYDSSGEVQVTPGSKFALYAAFQAFLDPGDEVILFDPCWGSYPALVRLAGARPVHVRLDPAAGWRLPRQALEDAFSPRTRIVVANLPNNPAGYVWSLYELDLLVENCARRGALLLLDELYADLWYGGRLRLPPGLAQAERRGHVVLVGGVSKSLAMSGWRLGFAAADRRLLGPIHAVVEQTLTCTPPALQEAAAHGLRRCSGDVEAARAAFAANAKLLLGVLAASPAVSCEMPAGGIYLFPRLAVEGREPGWQVAHLLENGVATVPGAAFGESFADHVRISFAVPEPEAAAAATKLEKALARL